MARSVEELRREAERNRAQLATTVDQLKDRMSDTVEDIRRMVSPQHIKSEVSDYFGNKAENWIEALKQQAKDNPMQAIAVGTALAVPLLRLARGLPLPLLMMGAGLALTSKTVRDRAAEAAGPTMAKAREMIDDASERAQSLGVGVGEAISSVQDQVTGLARDAQDGANALRNRAAGTTETIASKLRGGMEATKDTVDRASSAAKDTVAAAQDAAAAAPETARQIISDNAALIGGLGIAIGAIVAAALPKTEAEAKIMGPVSDSVKQAAGEATQSGLEAVKTATMSAADAAAKSVGEADLGGHASRMTQNLTDVVKEAADDVVAVAFAPSRNPNT